MSGQATTAEGAFNWAEIPDEPPPPIEPGIYQAVITKAEPEVSKNGKRMISLELQVTKAYGGADGELDRRVFTRVMAEVDKSAFRLKQLVQSAEVDPPPNNSDDELVAFCDRLLGGQPVWTRTKHRTHEGKTYAEVDRFLTQAQADEAAQALGAASTGEEGNRRRRKK